MIDSAVRDKVLGQLHDDEIIAFAQQMIRFESQNGHEGPIARWIADELGALGLKLTLEDVHDGRLNVIGVLPGKKEGIGLLFHGHTDTVPFLNMENPLSGEIVDGYIWGRGSCDQKGGVAASIMALKAIVRAGIPLSKGLAVAAVIDEESEHRGSYALVDMGLKADSAIVTEPSDLRLLLGCKGTAPIQITFYGKIAHGSNPWLGINAVEKAAKAVLALAQMPTHEVEVPRLGTVRSSINIGLISGGTAYNNVPHECTICIDRRMVPGETQDSCLAEIQQVLDQLASEDPDFKASMEIARPDWKWERIKKRGLNPAITSPDEDISQAVMRAHETAIGSPVELGYTNGYMDMDFLVNDLGIPTVNYGPGDTVFAHTDHEKLDIDELLKATRVYALTALEMCL